MEVPNSGLCEMSKITEVAHFWEQMANTHGNKECADVIDAASTRKHLEKTDPNYGRPPEGSLAEHRGEMALKHVGSEVLELCGHIKRLGSPQQDGTVAVAFGQLFEAYTEVSNKLVGVLLCARKQGIVSFPGEILYQRRDDSVFIKLLSSPDRLQLKF